MDFYAAFSQYYLLRYLEGNKKILHRKIFRTILNKNTQAWNIDNKCVATNRHNSNARFCLATFARDISIMKFNLLKLLLIYN